MLLYELGFTDDRINDKNENGRNGLLTGRIIAEHKERFVVLTEEGETDAEITGNMRFSARSREDFPAVGDWVALMPFGKDTAIIHRILPRHSVIKRQAVGQRGEVQLLAANIDFALLLQAVDRDFSINRLERYLTICNSSGVKPLVILTKADLASADRVGEISEAIRARIRDVPLVVVSNESRLGYDLIGKLLEKGKTYCMLGSSGVGKSTLLNNLSGRNIMKTGEISATINRGKHITSHRELFILDNGALLIDNPGMREVGIADDSVGLETTFDSIARLSVRCRYVDCTHTVESGCAVREAVDSGELDKDSYANWLKLEKEREYFETSAADRKKKEKIFGKIIKDYNKKDVKQRRV